MFKIIIYLCVLVVVVSTCTASQYNQLDSWNELETRVLTWMPLVGPQAKKGFDAFEKYLAEHEDSNDPSGLEAAKRNVGSSGNYETFIQRAARIYVYLNKLEHCGSTAIGYMYSILQARRYAEPGSKAIEGGKERPKTRLEGLLEDTLVRAGSKCRSSIPEWLWESEDSLSSFTKEMVNELISHELIRTKSAYKVAHIFADMIIADNRMTKELSRYDRDKLGRYFKLLITRKLIAPCMEYVKVMSPLMMRIEAFGFHFSRQMRSLFDRPSRDLLDSRSRFWTCEHFLEEGDRFLQLAGNEAAVRYRQERKFGRY